MKCANELANDNAVSRTALATQGLLKIAFADFIHKTQILPNLVLICFPKLTKLINYSCKKLNGRPRVYYAVGWPFVTVICCSTSFITFNN